MENMTFEKAITELEKIVSKMEKGKLSLEQSLELYEQGVRLSAFCKQELEHAQLKLEEINLEQAQSKE